MNIYILDGFMEELEKMAAQELSYTSLSSSSDKGMKAPGTDLGVSTRSPWYASKKKAPSAPDLGSNINRTSPKRV